MLKTVEEQEETNSRRLSLDTSPPHTPSPRPSTSSHHNNLSPPPSHPSPCLPGSPDSSSSSISPNHVIFHDTKSSTLPTPPHELQQSPLLTPPFSTSSPSPALQTSVTAAKASVVNRLIRDEPPASVAKIESGAVTGFADAGGITDEGGDGGEERDKEEGRRGRMSSSSMLRRAKKVFMLKRAALGLRWCEFVVCLVSFSVLAADRNRGWALDSFYRYKEFRYIVSVNVIGFVYSGLQACSMIRQFSNAKHITQSLTRLSFDFMMDQMLAYLLASASSSAATRVDDWILNWGKDKFPTMASASIGMSFLAFIAFSLSSLISGYLLCTRRSS